MREKTALTPQQLIARYICERGVEHAYLAPDEIAGEIIDVLGSAGFRIVEAPKPFTCNPNLTRDRLAVLKAIARLCAKGEQPTHREIARYCGQAHRASDWAHAKLKWLHEAGLIEPVGISAFSGHARTWALTDEGKRVLAEETRNDQIAAVSVLSGKASFGGH